MANPNMTRRLFVCDCGSLEHQFVVSCFNDDDDIDDWVYVSIHLAPVAWYKRVWEAVKYVMGKRSRYGAFEEMILGEESCQELGTVLLDRAKYYRKRRRERNSK